MQTEYNKRYFTEECRVKILFESGITRPHSHNFVEIVYFDRGTGYHNVDGVDYAVKSGDLFLLKRSAKHYYYSEDPSPSEVLFVYDCIFDESFFPEFDDAENFLPDFAKKYLGITLESNKNFYRVQNDPLYSFKPIFAKMFQEFNQKQTGYLKILKANVEELLVMILRKSVVGANVSEGKSHDDVVESIARYLDENACREFSLTDLSGIYFFSLSHLNRIFKSKMGITILQYANARRLSVVGGLLKSTNKSIEEIMEDVGYNDKKRFYETFKRHYHCTPGEFRRLVGGKEADETEE